MNWLALAFALEIGLMRGPQVVPFEWSSYVQMESTVTIARHLEIGGELRSYQTPTEGYAWVPFRMDYTVHITAIFGDFSFGMERLCYHPVSSVSIFSYQTGGYERLFIRFIHDIP